MVLDCDSCVSKLQPSLWGSDLVFSNHLLRGGCIFLTSVEMESRIADQRCGSFTEHDNHKRNLWHLPWGCLRAPAVLVPRVSEVCNSYHISWNVSVDRKHPVGDRVRLLQLTAPTSWIQFCVGPSSRHTCLPYYSGIELNILCVCVLLISKNFVI